ncbi:hypothetical protein L0337_39600 [candidate division KSB1 bacterium]|nr:hypothetical protein [candidate division KSB1 bacterium]
MQPSFDLFSVLMLIGAAHGILLGFTLLSIRRGNRTANRILALALIFFALAMALHTLVYSKYILRAPHLFKIEPVVMLFIGPLFHLYVKALTEREFKLEGKALLHTIPAILCVISLTPFYLLPANEKIRHLEIDLQGPCKHCLIITWVAIAQMFAYLIFSIRELILHARRIKESCSSIEKINLKWLQRLLVVFVLTWIIALGIQVLAAKPAASNYPWLAVAMVIFLIGYSGLRQPEIFSGAGEAKSANEIALKKKYEKSTLTAEKVRV